MDSRPALHYEHQECRTYEGTHNRHRNKQMVQYAVFREQELQEDEGMYDPEMLEQVSCEVSLSAREAALNFGLCDERIARLSEGLLTSPFI
jgi:hypothetical protein